jgi:hypothetical protein
VNIVQFGNQLSLNITINQGSTSVINQYQVKFNQNGTAQFQTFGFYKEATDVSVLYSVIAPNGVSM